MARKKRSKKRRKRRREVAAQARPAARPEKKKAAPPKGSPVEKARVQVDFRKEYPYVYSDLQRVAIIAATMLFLLVALSFILK